MLHKKFWRSLRSQKFFNSPVPGSPVSPDSQGSQSTFPLKVRPSIEDMIESLYNDRAKASTQKCIEESSADKLSLKLRTTTGKEIFHVEHEVPTQELIKSVKFVLSQVVDVNKGAPKSKFEVIHFKDLGSIISTALSQMTMDCESLKDGT